MIIDIDALFLWLLFGSLVADYLTGAVAGATACGVLAVLGNEVIGIRRAALGGGVIALVAGVAVTIATLWLENMFFLVWVFLGLEYFQLVTVWVIPPAIASLVFAGMKSGVGWRAGLAVGWVAGIVAFGLQLAVVRLHRGIFGVDVDDLAAHDFVVLVMGELIVWMMIIVCGMLVVRRIRSWDAS